jgi:heterotetrameric sarcosine oxidase gamma subunit
MSELETNNSMMQSPLHYLKGQNASDQTNNTEWGLTVTEANHGCYLNLRGDANNADFAAGITAVLNLALPVVVSTYVSDDSAALFWLGPDEWMIVSSQSAETLQATLRDTLKGHVSIVDVTGGQTQINLRGSSVPMVLKKSSSYDFEAWTLGDVDIKHCVQTNFAKATALVSANADGSINLTIRRSFADYIAQWLLDAGREHGCLIQG